MAWDIYGNPLRRGYCEVHPYVPEEYPCCECRRRDDEYERQRNEQELLDLQIKEHYELLEREHQEDCELKIVSESVTMISRFLSVY